MTITTPSHTAISPSKLRRQVADQRHAELVAEADATVSAAGRALIGAVVARLALSPTLASKVATVAALMVRGAVTVFKESTGGLKVLLALVIVGMVADLIAYPGAILGALNEGSRAAFGIDFFQVLAVIPPPVIVGYVLVVTATALAVVGVVKLVRKLVAH